jgi:hypothetical protein
MVLISRWIRPQSLILFFVIAACSGDNKSSIAIVWNDEQATGISIPRRYFSTIPEDSIGQVLQVYLAGGSGQPSILGSHALHDDHIVFEPLLPFTRGLVYDVRISGERVATLLIPPPDRKDTPTLLRVYPTQDTLPQNLLKVYLEFSEPMMEGQALGNVVLLRGGKDTVSSVFLDLKPELWNYDRTLLTLWLDPGRIKRDLQPNKRLGIPLEDATSYSLVIDSAWRDARGGTLGHIFVKDFRVAPRDSLSPDLGMWALVIPRAGTREPLAVNFYESMDAVLLHEAIHITGPDGKLIRGKIILESEETRYEFTPEAAWAKGKYILQCESRLEDLAGNNLNRLFDRDLTRDIQQSSKDIFELKFQVD